MVHPDPEAAARGDIPEAYARTLGVAMSPDGDTAVVLLATNEPPHIEAYQVVCHRTADGWQGGSGGNSGGWHNLTEGDEEPQLGVETVWGEAPRGATEIAISFAGTTVRVPVVDGHYLYAVWGVPDRFGFPDFPGEPDGYW